MAKLKKACFYEYDGSGGFKDKPLEVMINPSNIRYRVRTNLGSDLPTTGNENQGIVQCNAPSLSYMEFKLIFDLVELYEYKDSSMKNKVASAGEQLMMFPVDLINEGAYRASKNVEAMFKKVSSKDISVDNPALSIYPLLKDFQANKTYIKFICGRLPNFIGVIKRITQNIEYMSREGNPIRVTADVVLKSVNPV